MSLQKSQRPNILLITTDTSRCDTLHCMGYDFARSPNIDRLAAEGVMFTNAHTSSPVCSPARSSLITGLHTPVHGNIENGVGQRKDVTTLPDIIKDAGYRTIMIGKTHFGTIPESFDTVEGHADFKHWIAGRKDVPEDVSERPARYHSDSFFVDRTIEAIKKATAEDKPFFAFCSLDTPHPPPNVPKEFQNAYRLDQTPPLNYSENEEQRQPEHTKMLLNIKPENTVFANDDPADPRYWREAVGRIYDPKFHDVIREKRRRYYDYALFTDSLVGRLVDFIDSAGLNENTLILFTSDHGQQMFDHGFNDKHNYYDESWRIPFIIRMPGTLPLGEKREFAIWNDIAPTLIAAAGRECHTMQGYDLFTPLRDNHDIPRRCAVGSVYKSCAVATKRWKFEYYLEEGIGRLFDRQEDPKEQIDLYDSAKHRELRHSLERALLTWRADICDLETMQTDSMSGDAIIPPENKHQNVAPQAAAHVQKMKGTDAEDRLADAALEAERQFEASQ